MAKQITGCGVWQAPIAKEGVVADEAKTEAVEMQAECYAGCRYWLDHGDQIGPGYGDCRRYPPVVVPGADAGTTEVEWPITARAEWCGEHAPPQEGPR